ncbi:MAG: hypothetical protein GY778_13460 [bacterium]|nr:hypothetical protein [bacterium]
MRITLEFDEAHSAVSLSVKAQSSGGQTAFPVAMADPSLPSGMAPGEIAAPDAEFEDFLREYREAEDDQAAQEVLQKSLVQGR